MEITEIKVIAGLLAMFGLQAGGTVLLKAERAPADKVAPARTDAAGDPLPRSAVSRLGTLRWAHGTEVDYATYLHDGQQVLTVDQDGLFRVWDTPTGKLLRQFGKGEYTQLYWHVYQRNAQSRVIDVVGNPNSKHIVAVSWAGSTVAISHGDGNISLWEIATGKILRTFKANVATTLAFTPDGNSLFTRGLDQLVRQYDVQTGKEIRTFGEPRSNEKLLYCNDSGGLMVSADNKTVFAIHLERQDKQTHVWVRSWEIATGKERPALKGNKAVEGFTSVAFSPQAKLVALTDFDGVIHVWDLVASKEVNHLTGPKPENNGYSAAMAFSQDGKQLVTRSSYRLMYLWDLVEGKELRQLQIPKDRPSDFYTGDLAFSSDGLRIISPGRAGTVRQLETKSGKEIDLPQSRHRDRVETLALLPDGKAAVTLSEDHVLHLWNAEDGTEIKNVNLPEQVNQASFSLDGKVLALAGYDSKLHLRLWDVVHLKELREWEVSSDLDGRPIPAPRSVRGLALSANGKKLAVRPYEFSIKLWEVATRKDMPLREYRLPGETGEEFAFFRAQNFALSGDGTLFADLAGDKQSKFSLRLWEVPTGKLIRKLGPPQPHIRAFAFSPDGRTIATLKEDRLISLVEVASGLERLGASLPDQSNVAKPLMLGDPSRIGEVMCIVFSPDGNLLAAGDSAGQVRLFDVMTAKELAPLQGHIGSVISLAFAANSKRLASGSTDTTALVWDVAQPSNEAKPMKILDPKQLEDLWQDLRGDDATKAYQAIRVLREFPKQVVPFFQAKLHPAKIDQQQLTRLIGGLDDDDFGTREKAQKELEKLGELAEEAIKKALDGKLSPEVRTRLEAIRSQSRTVTNPSLEVFRSLEVLEWIGTPEAQKVVQIMARGAIEARITRDALATLVRMAELKK